MILSERGKIVVATDAGGLPENIVDNETGFICEMKNKKALAESIKKVIDLDERRYKEMSEKAVQNAKKLFDCQQYTEHLVELYKELLADKIRKG